MNEKQIEKKAVEEMAEIMCEDCKSHFPKCQHRVCGAVLQQAEALYNAGYRRQGENTVEVVRCCDCKCCDIVINDMTEEPKYFCTRVVGSIPVDPTDFCSHGAKMKGGE